MVTFNENIYLQGANRAERQGARDQQQLFNVLNYLGKREMLQEQKTEQQRQEALERERNPMNILTKMAQGQQVTPEQQAIAQVYSQGKVNPVTGESLYPIGGQIPQQPMTQDAGITTTGMTPKSRMEAEKLALQEQFDVRKEKRETERNLKESRKASDKAFRFAKQSYGDMENTIDKAIRQTDKALTTGIGGQFMGMFRGSGASDLEANLSTIQADSAFDTLKQMREASKTGGALGSVSERELSLLQNAKTALSENQSPEQLRENLRKYKMIRERSLNNVAEAYKEDFGEYPSGYEPSNMTTEVGNGNIEEGGNVVDYTEYFK